MTKSTWITIGLSIAVAAVLAGCSAAAGSSSSLASVDRRDLASMVVPKDELGPEARGLERDEDSGPSDNAAGAEDTLDPNDTARDLRSAGRIQGYDLYFTDFSALVGDAAGLAGVATSVELFSDAGSAERYMTKRLGEYDRFEGKEVDEVVLRGVRRYEVEDLGDQEAGVELELAQGKDTAPLWVVAVRVDRVVATANVFRTDDLSGEDYSRRVARALRDRIDKAAGA